jgi:hypothetical protein
MSLDQFDFGMEGVVDDIPQYCDIQPPFWRMKTADSVYGNYEDESNGPFLSKRDPLLSSSAGNLFALSAEVGTAKPREVFTQQAAASVQHPSLAQLKLFHALSPLTATMGSIQSVKAEQPEKQQNVCTIRTYEDVLQPIAKARRTTEPRYTCDLEVKEEEKIEESTVERERERRVGSVPISGSPVGGTVEQVVAPARARRRLRLRSMRSVSHASLSSGELSGHDSGTDEDFENENSPRKRGRKKEAGDDFSPNPERLLHINDQLKRLNKMMNDMTPVNEMPTHAKNKGRRERNKLASRACRLKKKATYEANKLKLHGLERERGKHDVYHVTCRCDGTFAVSCRDSGNGHITVETADRKTDIW